MPFPPRSWLLALLLTAHCSAAPGPNRWAWYRHADHLPAATRSSDPDVAFAQRICRLRPWLGHLDPRFPAAFAQLRRQLGGIHPGPARALFFNLAAQRSLYLGQHDAARWMQLALDEPVEDQRIRCELLLSAANLLASLDETRQDEVEPLLTELAGRLDQAPQLADLRLELLLTQSRICQWSGQSSIANRLTLAAHRIASLQHDNERLLSITAQRLNNLPAGPEANRAWDAMLPLAHNDNGWRTVLTCAPDRQRLERARRLALRTHGIDAAEVEWRVLIWLASGPRPLAAEALQQARRLQSTSLPPQRRLQLHMMQVRQLGVSNQHAAALDQVEAALKLREQLGGDPYWPAESLRWSSIACSLTQSCLEGGLEARGEQILQRGLQQNLIEDDRGRAYVLRALFWLYRSAGQAARASQAQAELEALVPSLDADTQLVMLEELPSTPQRLARLRDLLVARMQVVAKQDRRISLSLDLARVLRDMGDSAGEVATLLQAEQEATHLAPYNLQNVYSALLRSSQARLNPAAQLQLCRRVLQTPGIYAYLRGVALSQGRDLLQQANDPEALQWSADYLNYARTEAPSQLAAASRQDAELRWKYNRKAEAIALLQELLPGVNGDERFRIEQTLIGWLSQTGQNQSALQLAQSSLEAALASSDPRYSVNSAALAVDLLHRQKQPWLPLARRVLTRLNSDDLHNDAEPTRANFLTIVLAYLASEKLWDEGDAMIRDFAGPSLRRHAPTSVWAGVTRWTNMLPAAHAQPADTQAAGAGLDELRLARPELESLLTLRSSNAEVLAHRLRPGQTLVTYVSLGDTLYSVALHDGQTELRGSQISSASLDRWIDQFRKETLETRTAQPGRSQAESILYSALVEPWMPKAPSAPEGQLLIVPTGSLWKLPFAALRNRNGEPLAALAQLSFLHSGDLLRWADHAWQPFQLGPALVAGAPPEADLPDAAAELTEVAAQLPAARLLAGPDATPDRVKDAAAGCTILHLATHASFNPREPLNSALQLHDGQLPLSQLHALHLAPHCLVTLSCCDGGVSPQETRLDPISLAGAVSSAGAATVIAHLGSMDDRAGRLFFSTFYRALAAGRTPLQAFTTAQRDTRTHYPAPFYWAGFFLLGNPE